MRRKWVLSSIITISLLASFLTGTFPAHADSVTVDTTSDVADGITTSIAAHDAAEVGPDQAFATRLDSDTPIIVERAMYFANGGHNTIGIQP